MESKIHVAETGNKRAAVADADIVQAILDIDEWFKSNVPAFKSQSEASPDQIAQLQAPNHLQVLLSRHNGGMQLQDTYSTLSVDQIRENQAKVESQLLPFAVDIDEQLMCIDRSNNNILVWDLSDSSVGEDLKMTLGQYLESFRNKILMGTLVYAPECGMIEVGK